MNYKIKRALKEGKLIDYDKLFASYLKEKQQKIEERAKFIMARMELRKLRREKKLSQEKLAQKMKVKREFISRIESGKQNITLETLLRIAQATGKEFKFSFK
jgi:UDP-N-acetylglucosamine 1-carboxyvinyltransferase